MPLLTSEALQATRALAASPEDFAVGVVVGGLLAHIDELQARLDAVCAAADGPSKCYGQVAAHLRDVVAAARRP